MLEASSSHLCLFGDLLSRKGRLHSLTGNRLQRKPFDSPFSPVQHVCPCGTARGREAQAYCALFIGEKKIDENKDNRGMDNEDLDVVTHRACLVQCHFKILYACHRGELCTVAPTDFVQHVPELTLSFKGSRDCERSWMRRSVLYKVSAVQRQVTSTAANGH